MARRACLAVLACGLSCAAHGALAAGEPETPPTVAADVGNPLARIPLDDLKETRDRPLFAPTRRSIPPPPPPEPVAVAPPPPPPPVDTSPHLTLLGVVSSTTGVGVALLVDETDHSTIRLKIGESHRNWQLESIAGRTVSLRNGPTEAKLTIPSPGNAALSQQDD